MSAEQGWCGHKAPDAGVWRRIARCLIACGIAAFWLALFSMVAFAQLDVERVSWGIDGKLRKGKFNLVTVEVRNVSEETFDGELTLQPTQGLGQGADIPLVQPDVFIEPLGTRAVQFVVFVPGGAADSYTIRWGRGPDRTYQPDDDPPTSDMQAVVQFLATGQTEAASVPSVDDASFPTSVAGFDGVEAILLNHVPRWDELRARALKDWVYQGGTLHLFEETPGKFPEFGQSLAELNEPSPSFSLGGGRVVRHAMNLSAAKREYVLANISNSLERVQSEPTQPYNENDPNNFNNYYAQDFDGAGNLNTLLKQLTQPQHSWPLIYLLAILYLLAIFPGCWLLGRKRGDFRITYGVLIGVIALFSLGFRTVGARGYDEETVINTLAVARPVSGGRATVTQWGNFFVTGGGQFAIKHAAEGAVYGSGQANEAVRGFSLNRPYGEMRVDIPSFSGRTMVSTGVFKIDAPRFEVAEFRQQGGTPSLTLRIANFDRWNASGFHGAEALVGNSLYMLTNAGDRLTLSPNPRPVATELQGSSLTVYQNQWASQQELSADLQLLRAKSILMRQDLGIARHDQLGNWSLPADRVRVFLYYDLPEEMKATVSANVKEQGRLLWVVDVPVVPTQQTDLSVPAAKASTSESPENPIPAEPQ